MPIKIPDNLPAKNELIKENIFVMDESRAYHQDIRPLKILILNLMPMKQVTEVQLLRLLSNTPLQVEVEFLHMDSHVSKNTSQEHLTTFYNTFNEIKHKKFDGMIITGAPVEHLEFEQISYWDEIKKVMEWTTTNVTSTLYICWGVQAALYYHYGIKKYPLKKKLFGVFAHKKVKENVNILRGFDEIFYAPHSRHTEMRKEDILKIENLEILTESEEAGVHIIASKDGRQIFVTGHSEYDANTLLLEYKRDLGQGLYIEPPTNYFENNDPNRPPILTWRSHGSLLFSNWLNYYVYQETPYTLADTES